MLTGTETRNASMERKAKTPNRYILELSTQFLLVGGSLNRQTTGILIVPEIQTTGILIVPEIQPAGNLYFHHHLQYELW